MRILSLQPDVPEKSYGGRKRVFHLTEALVKSGHDLHMIAAVTEAELPRLQAIQDLGVHCHPVVLSPGRVPQHASFLPHQKLRALEQKVDAAVRFRRKALRTIGDTLPKAARSHWIPPLRKKLRELLAHENFDVVVIENEENSLLAHYIPPGVPVVVDIQNVLSAMAEREVRLHLRKDILDLYRWSERVQPAKLRRLERAMIERCDALVAMSEQEAMHLRELVPESLAQRVHVIENGVDTNAFQMKQPPPGQGRVVFTGLMSYYPNVDAMQWFLREVWPLVLHAQPQACLDIVGADPPPELCALADKFAASVHVTGRVEKVQPYFEKADVVIVPLHMGGGTRLKILEAAAMGRPMVSTHVGAEGLTQLRDGEHLLLRDKPQEFADGVIQLLSDPKLSQKLASEARRVVENCYDWSLIGHRFETVVASLAARP